MPGSRSVTLEQDSDAIDRLFRINIHAPYHASVEAARRMPEGGRIIVIGSVNGDRMPVPGMAAYAVSKSALQGLARGLAGFWPARHHGQRRPARPC
jgi:cyclic-di-GMP-binding biofilm dispersal mediator protein